MEIRVKNTIVKMHVMTMQFVRQQVRKAMSALLPRSEKFYSIPKIKWMACKSELAYKMLSNNKQLSSSTRVLLVLIGILADTGFEANRKM